VYVCVFYIFACAPTSDAFETLKSEFENALATAINRRIVGDVNIISADANASLN